MEIKIISNISKVSLLGEIVFTSAEMLEMETAFYSDIGKYIQVPGYRKGKAPASLVKSNLDPNLKDELFCRFINTEYYDKIFMEIRSFPKTINMDYLDSTLVTGMNEKGEMEIRFILSMSGVINLPKTLTVESTKLLFAVKVEEIAPFEEFKIKQELVFFAQNNEYQLSSQAAEIGDMLTISGNMVFAHNPELIIDSWSLDKIVLGANTFLPEMDKKMTGAVSMKRVKFTFIYPKSSPSQFAGQKVRCNLLVVMVEKLKYKTLEELLLKNKKLKSLNQSILNENIQVGYRDLLTELSWNLSRNMIAKELINLIPDFEAGDQNDHMDKEFLAKMKDSKQGNLKYSLETEWGRFESDLPNEDSQIAHTRLNYQVMKLECILLKIYNLNSKILNENYRMDEYDLEEEVQERLQNPEQFGLNKKDTHETIKMFLEKHDKMHAAMDWITDEILENAQVSL